MFKKLKENSAVTSILITVLTIYGLFLGYTTAASYRAGYLSYFGVSIDMVPFWPKISDFMIAPVIGVLYIVVIMILLVLAIIIGNYLGYLTVKIYEFLRKQKSQESLPRIFDKTTNLLVLALFVGTSFSLPYFTMQHFGESYARSMTQFTALKGREQTTVLIYQHEGTGIVKEYNPETKQFSSDYEVIDLAGQTFKQITAERAEVK